MRVLKRELIKLEFEPDIITARKFVRDYTILQKFSLTKQTKLVTAASELARNILKYAKEGTVEINIISDGMQEGIKLIFNDKGPGIADIPRVLAGGYTTGGGLGLGISGSKRLVDHFDITSTIGKGTCIQLILWK